MKRTGIGLLLGILLVLAALCVQGCRDPLDLPVPDPQPVRPFR